MPLAVEEAEESALAADLRSWRRILPNPARHPVPMPEHPPTDDDDAPEEAP